jgi:hypothetical protein
MNWYAASSLYEGRHAEAYSSKNIWEERIFLIRAKSLPEAEEIATKLARNNEVTYEVEEGDFVAWTFIRLERTYEIQSAELSNGTELFSRYLRASEVESLFVPFE